MCYSFLPLNFDLKQADEYQKNKIDWLKDSSYSENTKVSYFFDINTYIHPYEVAYGKDLYAFTRDEVITILKSINTISASVISRLSSSCSAYNEHCLSVGLSYTENVFNQIKTTDLIHINAEALKASYISIPDYYKLLNNLEISDNEKILLLLLRYGVLIKEVAEIKWEDISDGFIHLKRNGVSLPIDDSFMAVLQQAKKEDEYIYLTETKRGSKEVITRYVDYGFVIKQTDRGSDDIVTKMSLYTRINNLCKRNGIERMSVDALKRMRYFDFLYELYDRNKELTYDDAKNVVEIVDGISKEDRYMQDKSCKLRNLFNILSGIEFKK